MEEARHIAFDLHPEDEMPMIPHDAVRNNSHRALSLRPGYQLQKILEFRGSLEEHPLIVAAIDDVGDRTRWQFS